MSVPLVSGGENWWEHRVPFRHFRAEGVLSSSDYLAIASAFTEILDSTEGRSKGRHRMSRTTEGYDARMLPMDNSLSLAFSPFFEDRWIKSLFELLGLPFLDRIDGALHSSPKGSRSGWIHTDFCSAWFDESIESPSPMVFPNRSRCDYFTGRRRSENVVSKEYVRVATLIFYLCNDGWTDGDGGETALYDSCKEVSDTKIDLVPPTNNSLLLFECSPHSYHRFVKNPGCTRNSAILWLHGTIEYVESRWGSAVNRRCAR